MSNHPNSLKNLKPAWTSESAREAQKNSVIARKANAEARQQLKLSVKEWEKYKLEVLDDTDLTSLDILKVLMHKAMEEGDYHGAADLAKSLAEFEKPKLARTEVDSTIKQTAEMSDEELLNAIKELHEKSIK